MQGLRLCDFSVVTVMDLKRGRECESDQDSLKEGQESDTPVKKTAVDPEQPAEEPVVVIKPNFPEYLEQFVLNERYLFNRLIKLDSPHSIKEYFEFNLSLSDYFVRLREALFKLSKKEVEKAKTEGTYDQNKTIIRTIKSKKTQKPSKKINCERLVKVLNESDTQEAIAVIQLLNEGMQTWCLPLFLNLHLLALEKGKETQLKALTWIEKRRDFIQSAMNRDPKLLAWLKKNELDTLLIAFTEDMHQTLTDTIDIQLEIDDVRKIPKVMDVRALWETLSDMIDGEDRDNDSQILQMHTRDDLFKKNLIHHFTEISLSPWNCFLEIFNGSLEHAPTP